MFYELVFSLIVFCFCFWEKLPWTCYIVVVDFLGLFFFASDSQECCDYRLSPSPAYMAFNPGLCVWQTHIPPTEPSAQGVLQSLICLYICFMRNCIPSSDSASRAFQWCCWPATCLENLFLFLPCFHNHSLCFNPTSAISYSARPSIMKILHKYCPWEHSKCKGKVVLDYSQHGHCMCTQNKKCNM